MNVTSCLESQWFIYIWIFPLFTSFCHLISPRSLLARSLPINITKIVCIYVDLIHMYQVLLYSCGEVSKVDIFKVMVYNKILCCLRDRLIKASCSNDENLKVKRNNQRRLCLEAVKVKKVIVLSCNFPDYKM